MEEWSEANKEGKYMEVPHIIVLPNANMPATEPNVAFSLEIPANFLVQGWLHSILERVVILDKSLPFLPVVFLLASPIESSHRMSHLWQHCLEIGNSFYGKDDETVGETAKYLQVLLTVLWDSPYENQLSR